jgi:hypothetical protein
MTKAQWALAALFAAALPACAAAHGTPAANTTSLAAGRAAQPGSWVPGASRDAQSFVVPGPAGQAAQPGSWIAPSVAPTPAATRLADEGPSYLGGRAAQPYSWVPPSKSEPRQVAGL